MRGSILYWARLLAVLAWAACAAAQDEAIDDLTNPFMEQLGGPNAATAPAPGAEPGEETNALELPEYTPGASRLKSMSYRQPTSAVPIDGSAPSTSCRP